jgi:hypothetical protein
LIILAIFLCNNNNIQGDGGSNGEVQKRRARLARGNGVVGKERGAMPTGSGGVLF